MSGERTIYLIRHGAPELPGEESRCLGRLDVPLSEKGKRQAEALGGWLSRRRPDALYASPLARCRETAAAIGAACGLEAVLRADLRELDAGTWEGLTFSEIRRIDPEVYRRRGEDLADAAVRAQAFLREMEQLPPTVRRVAAVVKPRLDKLDIPVAELVIDEVVQL